MSYSPVETTLPSAIVRRISGPIVTCLTSSGIRITTSPPRRSIPKVAGFSLASAPRPGAPSAAAFGRPAPFSHRLGMALMSGPHTDFVALGRAGEDDRRPPISDPLAELPDRRPG